MIADIHYAASLIVWQKKVTNPFKHCLSHMLWIEGLHAKHIKLLTFANVLVCKSETHCVSLSRFYILVLVAPD